MIRNIILAISLIILAFPAAVSAGKAKPLTPVDIAREELSGLPVKTELKLVREKGLGNEGFRIDSLPGGGFIVKANAEAGLLYGAMRLKKAMGQTASAAEAAEAARDAKLTGTSVPAFPIRILNHWDNLDGTIERGYAGSSIWDWENLPPAGISPQPDTVPQSNAVVSRLREYAKLNAAVGINGAVINNVNASSKILGEDYLRKVATIADELRPYAMKVYLSVNFAAPMQLDRLPTADPLDQAVQKWWKRKADEIYKLIPDFGGFLVKANSEGQPGPCDFGRTHADGANMLARALRRHGGVVMWRAFVYSPGDADRAKQAYLEFQPLDGEFDSDVIVQIKNGPIDFQPREPFSPLFGAMPATDQMVEFQITQEYLGHSNHLAYLAPMWEEFFEDVRPETLKGVAGVANIGDSENFTAHPLARANWYAFGRLAWDPSLSSEEIVDEWLPLALDGYRKMPEEVREGLREMMLGSREAVVDYMMPLGLHHIFAFGHHYGPEPWCDVLGARPDWLPSYYHRADSAGIGFDRSPSGSDAVGQYPEPFRSRYADVETCPEELLLWFHHVPWTHRMKSGLTLWEEMGGLYQRGLETVEKMQGQWGAAQPWLDSYIYKDVERRLMTQARDAKWWQDACLLYFASLNGRPWPSAARPPIHTLEELNAIKLPISNYECPPPPMLDSVR